MRRLLIVLGAALLLALGVGLASIVSAAGGNGSPTTGQIGICHHTGKSKAHMFIFITPDASGVFDGHGKLKHQFGNDIIPAFSFVNSKGQTISFAGLNLSTVYGGSTGAQLLANRCRPGGTTTTIHTTTTVHATTTVHETTNHTTTVHTTTGHTNLGHGHTTTGKHH
jgi:hypothetical protein